MRQVMLAGLVIGLLGAAGVADEVRLPVTADNGICGHPKERELNGGRRSIVRLKGNEHYYLFTFDARQIRGWDVESAALRIKVARGNPRRIAACTVPVPWVEGTASNQPQAGASTYLSPGPTKHWPFYGLSDTAPGTILDATFNNPYQLWSAHKIRKLEDGWIEIPLAPRLVEAVAAGLSYGILLGEETGQTFENHDLYTREQSNAKPVVVVQGAPMKPAAIREIPLRDGRILAAPAPEQADAGGAIAVQVTPELFAGDGVRTVRVRVGKRKHVLTYRPSTIFFRGLPAGKGVRVHVDLQGRQAGGQHVLTAIASKARPRPALLELAPAASQPAVVKGPGGWRFELRPVTDLVAPDAKPLADDARIRVPLVPRNAWQSVQIVAFPPDGKKARITVRPGAMEYRGKQTREVLPLENVFAAAAWYVKSGDRYVADALAPLPSGAALTVPWQKDRIAAQTCQPLLLEVFVRPDATPGPYAGSLQVKIDGKTLKVPYQIEVAHVALPDQQTIIGDMNTYGAPGRALGVKRSDVQAYYQAERSYYRLAHQHRMTLNPLPYSQAGQIGWRGAPEIKPDGTLDPTIWHDHYGPLLDGSAFSAKAGYVGPGVGQPIHHMYLPLHENWPVPLADAFKPWPPPKDYQEFLKWSAELPEPVESFSKESRKRWGTLLRPDVQNNWLPTRDGKTRFQVYLNNKHLFRNPKNGSGRGISLWNLDEPMFANDFRALRYFGILTSLISGKPEADTSMLFNRGDIWMTPDAKDSEKRAKTWGVSEEATEMAGFRKPIIDYRIDISRPTHQRSWLDGLVDLNVCGGQLYEQYPWLAYRRTVFGEEYWNYKMPPSFGRDNTPWLRWAVQSYCWGAVGTLPWQTIGSDGDLETADATSLIYPGMKLGYKGPVASLRMKAWRDGIQAAELVNMLATREAWNEFQRRAFLAQSIGLSEGRPGERPAPDAGIVTFAGYDTNHADQLIRTTAAMLTK